MQNNFPYARWWCFYLEQKVGERSNFSHLEANEVCVWVSFFASFLSILFLKSRRTYDTPNSNGYLIMDTWFSWLMLRLQGITGSCAVVASIISESLSVRAWAGLIFCCICRFGSVCTKLVVGFCIFASEPKNQRKKKKVAFDRSKSSTDLLIPRCLSFWLRYRNLYCLVHIWCCFDTAPLLSSTVYSLGQRHTLHNLINA